MSSTAAVASFVRFDSSRGGRSLELRRPVGEVVADRPEDVVPALARLEREMAAGHHVGGFIAYEAASGLDPALVTSTKRGGLPLLWFGLFAERCDVPIPAPGSSRGGFSLGNWEPSISRADYDRAVDAIRDWIAAGDTYQVNYTFPLAASFAGDDEAFYRHLCASQRAGYCAFLRLGNFSIASASPELFFRWSGGELELRPMKGTRPRGRWTEEDDLRAAELLASEKERAENLMIVDLLRNDAGRVAEYGSVRVGPLFETETYPTVHQLTSTIRARTRDGVMLTDFLRAVFPSGSVTGAPKIRTMQIIAELEADPRGIYTGAIGFVSDGEAVFNVPIRTVVLDRASGRASLGVGSGVTYDSRAVSEFEECLQKAVFTHHAMHGFELLETMSFDPRRGIRLREEHLSRLAGSARYFGVPLDVRAVNELLDRAGEGEKPLRLRLLVSPEGVARLERYDLASPPDLLHARIDDEPVNSGEVLLYHKTTWREPYECRKARHPGYDEVLLLNERGELTEFTNGNLVIRDARGSWTPPVAAGLLPGTLRAALLRDGAVRERVLYPSDLGGAECVYRINSVHGWTRVIVEGTRIDDGAGGRGRSPLLGPREGGGE